MTLADIRDVKCLLRLSMNSLRIAPDCPQRSRSINKVSPGSPISFLRSLQTLNSSSGRIWLLPSRIILELASLVFSRISKICKMASSTIESFSVSGVIENTFFSLGLPRFSFSRSGFEMLVRKSLSPLCLFFTCVQAAAYERQLLPHLQIKSLLSGSFRFLRCCFGCCPLELSIMQKNLLNQIINSEI